MRILFICKNNASRSQMAVGFLKKYSKKHVGFSAGTAPASEGKVGRPPTYETMEEMKDIGIDISKYRRTQLRYKLAENADRIIVIMTKGQTRLLLPKYIKNNKAVSYWYVIDPQKTDRKSIILARDKVDKLVKALVRDIDKA